MSQNQDQVSIKERRDIMELDAHAAQRVSDAKAHILKHLPEALDRYEDKIRRSVPSGSPFAAEDVMQSGRSRQTQQWNRMASGSWDEEFLRAGREVGHANATNGLDLKYYMSGYALVVEEVVKGVMTGMLREGAMRKGPFGLGGKSDDKQIDHTAQTVSDLVKVLILDMELAISSYVHQTRQETETVNAKMQGVLSAAVEGDFDQRVDVEVKDENLNALIHSTNQLMTELGDRLEEADDALFSIANADLTHRIEGKRLVHLHVCKAILMQSRTTCPNWLAKFKAPPDL